MGFSLNAALPNTISFSEVLNTDSNYPTINWTLSDTSIYATAFNIWIGTTGGTQSINTSVNRVDICDTFDGITCSYVLQTPLTNGDYVIYVEVIAAGGTGVWLEATTVTIASPAPLEPSGLTTTGSLTQPPVTPIFTWDRDENVLWYQIYVDGPSGNVMNSWHEANLVCDLSTCSVPSSSELANGNYQWWVGGWNSVGQTWNTVVATFTVNVPAPLTPDNFNIIGSLTQPPVTPTFTWDRDENVLWYQIYVDGPSGNVMNSWHEASLVCDLSTCSVPSSSELANGNYGWWLGGWNSTAQTWTVEQTFTLTAP